MIERVMLLDAVLDDREFVWLGPSMDVVTSSGTSAIVWRLGTTRACCSAKAQRRMGKGTA